MQNIDKLGALFTDDKVIHGLIRHKRCDNDNIVAELFSRLLILTYLLLLFSYILIDIPALVH